MTLLSLQGIRKSFGAVDVLHGVDLKVAAGEVVGLVGDNGAGKSTLIKILSGVVKPTSGEILVRGKPVSGWSAARSRDAGIETVFQDRALAVQQTIVRNIFMGRELTSWMGWLKVNKEIEEASRLMREIGFTSKVFTPHSIVGQLSGGERQGVAIARAILFNARILIMDEPTAALGPQETAQVGELVKQLKADGIGIFLISHDIHDVFELADRVCVMKNGQVVGTARTSDVTQDEVLGMIILGKCPPGAIPGPGALKIAA
ncbi:MAG: sugar ABC transporter ATP-binding protein [Mesorhizobium sp.]|nr:MAG: sugar ABC transporter ATP-binding protein [Mesorhizobium sp.]